jgi:predicted RNA-binding Zn-ribbon protein involved in translation (DUF1610 family)
MKKLYGSQNRVLLYLVKSRLDDLKINSFMKNETPPAAGEVPPMIAWPELWVMDDERFTAAEQCLQEELTSNKLQHDWVCPKCGEKLEAQFEICWKCGVEREI